MISSGAGCGVSSKQFAGAEMKVVYVLHPSIIIHLSTFLSLHGSGATVISLLLRLLDDGNAMDQFEFSMHSWPVWDRWWMFHLSIDERWKDTVIDSCLSLLRSFDASRVVDTLVTAYPLSFEKVLNYFNPFVIGSIQSLCWRELGSPCGKHH